MPTSPIRWRALLEGEKREQALQSVREIVAALDAPGRADRRPATFLAEQALLHAYLGFAEWGNEHFERSSQLLEQSIDVLGQTALRPCLHGGFVEIAWVVEHLQRHPLSEIEDPLGEEMDPNEQVDEVLRDHLGAERWNESYDLISGLVGIGVYAAERMPRAIARECFQAVVAHLEKLARSMESGVTWWTPQGQLPSHDRAQSPEGHANLGVAHGVPGAIALLARACADCVSVQTATPLLRKSISWLTAQKLPPPSGSSFGYNASPGCIGTPARSAWCYGDPGIAAALMCAARWVRDEDLEREARAIALSASRRPPEACGVVDAPLCHGAAGLGHLYNRLYQGTGDETYLEVARLWFSRALDLRKPGKGVGGYEAWRPTEGEWVSDSSFLSGATGVALAYLAATTDVEPAWDRLLLASVPMIDF